MARHLRSLGFEAAALAGGYNAWRRRFPVEPKQPPRLAAPPPALPEPAPALAAPGDAVRDGAAKPEEGAVG